MIAAGAPTSISVPKSAIWPAASVPPRGRCSAAAISSTEGDKARAWRETGALAVDLESAIVARAAQAAGIPFVVLRTIADPAARELPPAALIPLAKDGTPAIIWVLGEVLRRPQQIAALFGLARETRRALSALAGPARALREAFAAA